MNRNIIKQNQNESETRKDSVNFARKRPLRNHNAIITDDIQKTSKRQRLTGFNDQIDFERYSILKDRYILSESDEISKKIGYNCLDIYTNENFLCKIINESYENIILAYFNLEKDTSNQKELIKKFKDIIPIAKKITYLVIDQNHFGDLHTYLKKRKYLKETEAKILFQQICETVQSCHKNGILLRDLKLRKFFFSDRDRSKLYYESLEGAVILNENNDDSLDEKIACPLYVAPEIILTNTTYGGRSADMWALGIILYTMLTGKYPFTEQPNLFVNILRCHVFLPDYLSNEAKCLIQSLLRRNPDERLLSEDIFYHPWFKQDIKEMKYFTISSTKQENDQIVPDIFS